jgi:hypothetical protein
MGGQRDVSWQGLVTGPPPMTRSCLHCVLTRVLAAEASAFAKSGLEVSRGREEATWLPDRGGIVYRRLKRLFRDVRAEAGPGPVRITTLASFARSHVEVLATFRVRNGWRTLSCLLPRYVLATLWHGYAEHAEVV